MPKSWRITIRLILCFRYLTTYKFQSSQEIPVIPIHLFSERCLFRILVENTPENCDSGTNLQNVNAFPSDPTLNFVGVIEVSSEHLGWLVDGMFNLHRDTRALLRLFDNLQTHKLEPLIWIIRSKYRSYIYRLMINLQRRAGGVFERRVQRRWLFHSHFPQFDDLFLLDDTKGCADSERTLENFNTQDDWIPRSEYLKNL